MFNASLRSNPRSGESQPGKALGDVLSADATKRDVEVAFVGRFMKAVVKSNRVTVKSLMVSAAREGASFGKDAMAAKVEADYAMMRSPAFEKLAKELEKDLPTDATFGKFRGG